MSINVGDLVQIRGGAIDVTDGQKARAGRLYGEGGPLWATVVAIVDNWATGSRWGLPAYVTKVRCSNQGVVVWQVQPEDICPQTVTPAVVETTTTVATPVSTPEPAYAEALATTTEADDEEPDFKVTASNGPYSPDGDSIRWHKGSDSDESSKSIKSSTSTVGTAYISDSMFYDVPATPNYWAVTDEGAQLNNSSNLRTTFKYMGYSDTEIAAMMDTYKKQGVFPDITAIAGNRIKRQPGKFADTIYRARYLNNWQSSGRRKEMLNGDKSRIQNGYGYPYQTSNYNVNSITSAKYDYRFIPGDTRYSGPTRNLENRLRDMRASLGIPVHGNNDIARSMKMYMYNRFKVPDTNLAHNRVITHVFFTRPDIFVLDSANEASKQARAHTDTALIWRTHPELFKLLTNYKRCGDSNNLNMLLSNQVTSFNLNDEELSAIRHGKSWAEHEMVYGEQYTGRTAGDFSCTFTETSSYDVITLMKLWMTYIDNVSRGAWHPYYPDDDGADENCHVYDRALDYAASVYIFKCAPDGEEILYWSKYYGVFPLTTGASALDWELANQADSPKLNIKFAYSFKKDLSPISLLEFNNVANANGDMTWIPSYDVNLAHCSRPFVGAPYIEMDLGVPNMGSNDVNRATKRTTIKLKFRQDTSSRRSDDILFKSNVASYNGSVAYNA